MKTADKLTILFLLLFFAAGVFAQNNIPIGTWRTHLTYRDTKVVAVAGNKIYAATGNSLFFFDKEDNSTTRLTKTDGFSGVNISTFAYHHEKEILLIAYEDGNIDFLTGNEIANFDLIKRTQLRGSKKINHIQFYQNSAYLSTDFGVVVLDLEQVDIIESYLNIGAEGSEIRVNSSTIARDSLFLATDQGIIAAPVDSNTNLQDYNNWRRLGKEQGLELAEATVIETLNNKIYVGTVENEFYIYDGLTWKERELPVAGEFYSMKASGESLFIAVSDQLLRFTGNDITIINHPLIQKPGMATIDEENNLWIADLNNGLISDYEGSFNNYFPSGPFSENSFKLCYSNDKIIAVSGGYDASLNPYNRTEGFYVFEEGAWTNYNPTGIGNAIKIPQVEDLVDVVYQPESGNIFFASFEDGLLEWKGGDQFNIMDENTPGSSLTNGKLTGVAFDDEGALWITSQSPPHILHRLLNGEWTSYNFNADFVPKGLIITDSGIKWIKLKSGILVFDEESGEQRLLTDAIGEGDLPGNRVTDLAIDHEGQIWVGTEQGIAFFTNPAAVFSGDFRDASLPVYQNRFLFRNELITAIRIDGGNRKWIGTENGLWLFGDDADTLIYNFTEENSPLLSNKIIDIAIEENSGEVFIATDKGIISFRGTGTRGAASHQNVKIFPNPVTKNFTGLVGISGLVNDAIVKITDVSGSLVREFRAEGGTATWNVADVYGRRVNTGVYLVFSASDDGEETFVGKIAVVN